MSYSVAPARAQARPGVVTAASALLYFCAGRCWSSPAVGVCRRSASRARLTEEVLADTTGVREARALAFGSSLIVGSVARIVLAIGICRARRARRQGQAAGPHHHLGLAGLGVLCLGCGLAGRRALADQRARVRHGWRSSERRTMPAWQTAISTALNVAVVLALDRGDHPAGAAGRERVLPQGAAGLGAADDVAEDMTRHPAAPRRRRAPPGAPSARPRPPVAVPAQPASDLPAPGPYTARPSRPPPLVVRRESYPVIVALSPVRHITG